MSFLGLVSEKAPKNMEEIARLNWIIKEMERMNVSLRDERDVAKTSYEGMIEHNKSRDKERNALLKQINKLNMEIMLEKKSSSGLQQKNGAMSIDLTLRKEEKKVMMEEQIFSRKRVKEMEKQLSDDRAKRLRNLHENELLRKKNVELEARCGTAETAAQKAGAELLEKLQVLETTLELVATQRRTIEAQGLEMLELNREVTVQKESMRDLSDRCLRLERQLAERQKERDAFETESFRLRREIMQMGVSASEKAAAFSSFEPRSRAGSAAGLTRANTTMSGSRSRPSSMRAGSPVSLATGSYFPPGSAGNLDAGSTFGTDSSFQTYRPEVDNAPLITPLATPGDRRPRTRHVSTTVADTRTGGSMSPVQRNGLSRTRTEPLLPRVDTMSIESISTAEMPEALDAQSVHFDEGFPVASTMMSSTMANTHVVSADSPAVHSSPYPHSASPASTRKINKSRDALKLEPMSDLAASYLANTRSPGAGKAFNSSKGKVHKGVNGSLSSMSIEGSTTPMSKVKQQHLSERSGSGFVGQGLGLRVEPLPPYSAGGGPKAVLARILAESQSMD